MDLLGEVVKHNKFGMGTIVESKDEYIMVQFNETKEAKKFLYPEAIGDFLELQNKSSSDNEAQIPKQIETVSEGKNEQKRVNEMKKMIKREKSIKKIIGIRRDEDKDKNK